MLLERWILLSVVGTATSVVAFAPSLGVAANARRKGSTSPKMAVDPMELLSSHHHPTLEAVLSTLYATGDVLLKPAHEHTQPLFGPPDPFLVHMKSIAPLNPNAFAEAGLADTVKQNALQLPEKVGEGFEKAASAGFNVINPANILKFDDVLPGFQKSHHFLPEYTGPEETKESLIVEMSTISGLMRVMNQLPRAAFLYVLLEFFLVRPGFDVYKEEVDEDRLGATTEFLFLTGTRLGLMSILAVFCLGVFDK